VTCRCFCTDLIDANCFTRRTSKRHGRHAQAERARPEGPVKSRVVHRTLESLAGLHDARAHRLPPATRGRQISAKLRTLGQHRRSP
jgi:hypothetical protein